MRVSAFPKVGMKFEDVRKRVKRIAKDYKTNPKSNKQLQLNLISSLTNQAALHEGEGARKELQEELNYDTNNHSAPRCGWSRQYDRAFEKIFGKSDKR